MKKLNEGMWAGDLEDLLQPLVSIDEYESKIDDDAVAIGFFVNDRDAADDLNRFIQRSAVPILDSDVSPAPDQRGYYIVFAELARNDRLIKNILDLLNEVGQLGRVSHWHMKMRGIKDICLIDERKMMLASIRNSLADKISTLSDSIKDAQEQLRHKK